ncbi:ParA family protein [Candidatus Rickettsia kedanie]|uniref:ParA family protein n=1 Tax=Candidatus Rickettsia kedanie TaxID=3115352 RepID=A0ABP9TZF7_9RICK
MSSQNYCNNKSKKGGGKSTIAVNISFGLYKKTSRVLLIDLEPQAHSSCIYCPETVSYDKTIATAFINKKLDINNIIIAAIVHNEKLNNLKIIPSNIKLATVIEQISSTVYRERILQNHLNNIKKDYDYIILDCPPTLGILAINAVYCANAIIIPTNYGRYSLDGMADLLTAIQEIKEEHDYKFFILKNLYEQKKSQTNRYINEQLNALDKHLLTTIIRKNEAINQA